MIREFGVFQKTFILSSYYLIILLSHPLIIIIIHRLFVLIAASSR